MRPRLVRMFLITASLLLALVPLRLDARAGLSRLTGRVVDVAGTPVAGVVVSLRAPGEYRRSVTGSDGGFAFDALPSRVYTVKGAASAFETLEVRVDIAGGELDTVLTLEPGVSETITVLSEDPLVDAGRAIEGIDVTSEDLALLPSTGDPWAVLRNATSVFTDRVNVGGVETPDHPFQVSKGAAADQSTFSIDGTPVTDMVEAGILPAFFDFESFSSTQVITAASDPRLPTAGVHLRMSVKRGGDRWRGMLKTYFSNDALQTEARVPAEAVAYMNRGSSIREITEIRGETGGPIRPDQLWVWAGASSRRFHLVPAEGEGYGTSLAESVFTNLDVKANGQWSPRLNANAALLLGEAQRRADGVSELRPPETGWNERNRSLFARAEATLLSGATVLVTPSISVGRFALDVSPVGSRDVDVWFDTAGAAHRSYWFLESDRPQVHAALAASSFSKTRGIDHELRGGVEFRRVGVRESAGWPGSGNYTIDDLVVVNRNSEPRFSTEYASLWLGDTLTRNRLTVIAGVRADLQRGRTRESTAESNALFPELLPASHYSGPFERVEWRNIAPRVGATFALGPESRTVVRAGWNRYIDQLTAQLVGSSHPFWDTQGLVYIWDDHDGDHSAKESELFRDRNGNPIFMDWFNLDPSDRSRAFTVRRIDADLDAPTVTEWTAGIEHQLGSHARVAVNVTHRVKRRLTWTRYEKTRGGGDWYTKDDYEVEGVVAGVLPDGRTYELPYYALRRMSSAPAYEVITNRPDYEQTYDGIELVALRRFSGRWMARASATWTDWRQHVGAAAWDDPTPLLGEYGCSTCDDDIVMQAPARRLNAKEAVFMNPRWMIALSAMCQLPRGVMISASLFGRDGYPIPYVRTVYPGDRTGPKDVLVAGARAGTNEDVFELDLRLAKETTIHGYAVSMSLDAFNVTDRQSVLQRSHRLNNLTAYPNPGNDHVIELQSPRALRLGARVTF